MKWDIRALAVLMRWDYGKKERGIGGEESIFLQPLTQLCREARPFWYDEYMADPAVLERELRKSVEEYAPDVIFFTTYTDQYRPEFLDELKAGSATVAWFGDDQWRFENYTRRYANHFTLCATSDPWALEKYKAIGARAILSQWAADPNLGMRDPLPPDGPFVHDVSFIGARNQVRSWYVRELEKQGIKVTCYGYLWPNGLLPYNKMADVFQTSRINLNLSNSVQREIDFVFSHPMNLARFLLGKKRVEQMKARNFEIPLGGGFELSHYAPALERYLDIGKEIAIFNNPEQCAQQIKYYLANPDERCAMAARAHQRTLNEHTYKHRLDLILQDLFPRP